MKHFKTESKKLLDLMANSIYTNRDIFLRELISNASDAIDKLSFQSLTDSSAKLGDEDLEIRLSFNKDERTITVSDNGIGMTEAELEENLGTIAHSGSEQFKQANAEAQGGEVDIIGQFGVGFYASFMVAKQVRVVSRAFGSDETYVWESNGIEGYTLEPADDQRSTHGTDVILWLRDEPEAPADGEDAEVGFDKYLSEWGLRDLVTRYSNYVRHPIRMMVTKSRQLPKPEDAPEDYTPEYEDYEELETLNSMTPIWRKRKQEVEQSDYDEFYKSTFHDWDAPARTIPFHVEGTLDYHALLFVPGRAPFDLYSKDYQKGLALYSSNVLIMEKCADLLPDYYNFVRGVVDSPDVSLNISRETLQQDRQLRAMARSVERQITRNLQDMRDNDREAYEKFYENFGRGLKFGIYNSYGAKSDPLADLLLFWSAKDEKFVTFAEYVAAMPEEQEAIYFVTGDSRGAHGAGQGLRRAAVHAGRGRVHLPGHAHLSCRRRCGRLREQGPRRTRLRPQERDLRRPRPRDRGGEGSRQEGHDRARGPLRGACQQARPEGREGRCRGQPHRRPGTHHHRGSRLAGDGARARAGSRGDGGAA